MWAFHTALSLTPQGEQEKICAQLKPATHNECAREFRGRKEKRRKKRTGDLLSFFFFFLKRLFPRHSLSSLSASGMESVTQLQDLLLIVGFYFYFLLPSHTPDEIILPELTQLEVAGIRGASEEVMQFHFH